MNDQLDNQVNNQKMDQTVKSCVQLFKHSGIEFHTRQEDDYRMVRAIDDIPIGTLLYVEVMTRRKKLDDLVRLLGEDCELFTKLYPRTEPAIKLHTEQILEKMDPHMRERLVKMDENEFYHSIVASAKIVSNIFETKSGYMLGTEISLFNHSCQSTCAAVFDSRRPIVAVFSIKPIKNGEELTISYNGDIGHGMGSPFECACKATEFERKKRFNVTTDLALSFLNRDQDHILDMYESSKEVKAFKDFHAKFQS
jgi:hypothetical protein